MDNREQFDAWFSNAIEPDNKFGYDKEELWWSWSACAEQKDKEIAELKELTDHINKVWADTYPDAVDATTMLALKNRIKNLAEDRACWVFNAKVLQNKLNAMEGK